ncbi:MAG: short-chain dehydrogenase [Planctomycetaceae bacterium]|nr:short-chain dehydrogenase [Planctomycetaceae bacterium]
MPDRPTALITGASGGLGAEFAQIHAARGGDLILVARSADKLAALQAQLHEQHGVRVTVIARDLAETDACERLVEEIRGQGLAVDYLLNNAGFGGAGEFVSRPWADDRQMILLNVLTLSGLTRLLLPEMLARGSGRVLNVGSLASFLPGPLQATYYATKAYVLSLSEALANEVSGTGVTVTCLCPGPTKTGFADRADAGDTRAFRRAAAAADVARYGYDAMLAGKRVAVHGWKNKLLIHGLLRLMPRRLVTQISRMTMEKP